MTMTRARLADVVIGNGGIQTGPFGSQLHASDYVSEGVGVVMPADMIGGRINHQTVARVSADTAERLRRHRLVVGDILFSRRGDIGRFAIVSRKEDGWLCGTGCLRVRLSHSMTTAYAEMVIEAPETQKWLQRNAVGQTMLNLSASILQDMPLVVCDAGDQSRWAACNQAVIQLSRLLELEIDAKRKYKRGVTQQLLTGQRRFPEFRNRPRRLAQIEDMATLVGDRIDPKKSTEVLQCIELEHIESETGRLLGYTTTAQLNSIKTVFGSEDVLFGKLRPYLRKFARPRFRGVCSTEIWALRPIVKEASTGYLYHLLDSSPFRRAANAVSGSKMPRADWSVVAETTVWCPALDEQERVASMLDALDRELDLLAARRERVELYKRGLLSRLLSGELKVPA